MNRLLLIGFMSAQLTGISQTRVNMKKIGDGTFIPLYGVDSVKVTVQSFYLDVYPVTNGAYLNFVKKNLKWRKSKSIKLFTDSNYLLHWKNDSTLGKDMHLQSPVTNVSWYAAKAYCENQGKRLPTLNEWEYVARATETIVDGQQDSLFNQRIVESYERPRTYAKQVGSTFKNYWGIYDLHGMVWEWTLDFSSVLISGESRKDGDTDRQLFCAAGSVGVTELMDYAAFMRYAFRGSIKADYCIQNLGFRCALDVE